MKGPGYFRKRQRSPVFIGFLLFELVLILLQLYLFVSALEGLLAGEHAMLLPAAIISALCLGVNTWMLIGVNRTDHD
ncbi:MAG: DUF6755 family protein [Fimbriimonadales bacterium]